MISKTELKGIKSTDLKLLAILRLFGEKNKTYALRLRWSAVSASSSLALSTIGPRLQSWIEDGKPWITQLERSGKGCKVQRQLIVLNPWKDPIPMEAERILFLPPHHLRAAYILRAHPEGITGPEVERRYGVTSLAFRLAADALHPHVEPRAHRRAAKYFEKK